MKNLKFSILMIVFVFLYACRYDQDDNINSNTNLIVAEIIRSDSDLFNNLKNIASSDEEPYINIACIDFVYPLTIYVFNANDELLFSNLLGSDNEFIQLLNSLEIDNSISVSFPITSTLESGEEFTINTKEELEETINNCLEEELIAEFNGVVQNCILKIGYSYNDINPYLGSIFNPSNGQINITLDGNSFNGSWTVFTIEQELHININLIDDTEVGDYFNFDWKAEYLDANSLLLKNGDREIILNQRCDNNFLNCSNFTYEVCENEFNSRVSDFILDNYTACIFDTLELNEAYEITYHATEEDALNNTNVIISSNVYNNTEETQDIFVRLYDDENDEYLYPIINIKSIGC